jgi:hypothetical protein
MRCLFIPSKLNAQEHEDCCSNFLDQVLATLPETSSQVRYCDLRKAVQEAYDRDITVEYEKRERMVARVLELEREN